MALATIIRGGEIFAPKALGESDILCIGERIVKIGDVDEKSVRDLGLEVQILDASDCFAFPGFIDPHEHIIGGSGERGFASRSPQITLPEIVLGGITTVVGCIGTDIYSRNMQALLAQAREFNEEGITAFIYSGGYSIPPSTLTGNVRNDMVLIPEVIGAGEMAISDLRGSHPTSWEIARVVADCYVGGTLTGKAGITHFHIGDGKAMLDPLIEIFEKHSVDKASVYPTHVNRNDPLLKQAATLSQKGHVCDMDTTDEKMTEELQKFVDWGGDLNNLTLSTDASHTSPQTLWQEVVKVHNSLGWGWEKILPLITTNPARILKFSKKGRLAVDADADITMIDKRTLSVKHVLARGKIFVRDSEFIPRLKCMMDSNRKIELHGQKKEG
ncbi:MAG: amidohydrolase family protein [Bacteriovoracaceae bacterium]